MKRRTFSAAVVAATSVATLGSAHAQSYPARPIRLVVPYGVGGPLDLGARSLAAPLSRVLGQPIIIDNRPGANSVIGMKYVTTQPADGYTLMYHGGSMALLPIFNKAWDLGDTSKTFSWRCPAPC